MLHRGDGCESECRARPWSANQARMHLDTMERSRSQLCLRACRPLQPPCAKCSSLAVFTAFFGRPCVHHHPCSFVAATCTHHGSRAWIRHHSVQHRHPDVEIGREGPASDETQNTTADFDLEMERNSLVDAINIMVAFPNLRAGAAQYLRSKLQQQLDNDNTDGDDCFRSVSTLAKLDDEWVAAFLAAHTKLAEVGIARMKAYDGGQPKMLLQYILQGAAGLHPRPGDRQEHLEHDIRCS